MFDIAVKFSSKISGKMYVISSVESELCVINDFGRSISTYKGTFSGLLMQKEF